MDLLEEPRNRLSEFGPVSVRGLERPTVHAAVLFASLTVLLTFPILLRPDRIYLTAPVGEFLFEGTDHFYVSRGGFREAADHVQHMDTLETAANRWQSGDSPLVVNPTFTVPPAYLLTGALVVSLLPVEAVVFHNGFFLLSMFLAGFFTFLLVQKLTDDPNVALLAGALYMSSFFLFNEYLLGHTNQWQIQWIPLILYGVERVRDPTDGRNVVLLGVAFLLQVMSSAQYSVYLSFVLPLYIGLRYLGGAREFRRRRFWVRFVAAGLLALLLAAPFLWERLSLAGETPTYSLAENAFRKYVLDDMVGAFFVRDIIPQLGFRLVLLLGGIVAVVAVGQRRQLVPFLGLLVTGVVLALGPFEPWAPYAILHQYWPLIEFYRVPYRMLPFAVLGASVLSAGVLFPLTAGSEGGWSRRALLVSISIITLQVILVHSLLQFAPYTP